MKRLILSVFMLLLIPAIAIGASTITAYENQFPGLTGRNFRVITLTLTYDGTATDIPDTQLRDILTTGEKRLQDYGEWWLFKVEYRYGGTAPTDNSDLYIWSSSTDVGEAKLDLLGGSGVDAIDNATNNTIYPATSTQPLTGFELLDVDNNSVNSSSCTLKLFLYK